MAAVVAGTLWVAVAIVGLGWGAVVQVLDDGYCEKVDSNYGKLSWSVVPPGPVCTWAADANGVDEVEGPSPVMSVWLVSLGVLGGVTVWLVRRARVATAPEPIHVRTLQRRKTA